MGHRQSPAVLDGALVEFVVKGVKTQLLTPGNPDRAQLATRGAQPAHHVQGGLGHA